MARSPRPLYEVQGERELRKALAKMDDRLGDLRDVHRAAAEPVADTGRQLVPFLTGALLDTIRIAAGKTGASVRAGRARVPYAGVIHFGWPRRNIEPQPFLYDAADTRRADVRDVYERGVADLVRRFDLEAPD